MKQYRIAITTGEPAGIGPDILIKIAQRDWPVELVVCADAMLLHSRAKLLNLPLKLLPFKSSCQPIPQKNGTLTLLHIPLHNKVTPGQLCTENSHYVIETLVRTCDGCLKGEFAALVTGPVNKKIINEAGINFSGHTEFLKERTRIKKAVMMLVIEEMRIALATTHLPLKSIPNAITSDLLRETINILHHALCTKFNILQPHILVCGLNPHAGEGGYIGTEEIDTIIPVLKEMQAKGMNIIGPLPADTIFQPKYLDYADVILVMYHDQGLPVIKYRGFGRGVNLTLGLPFIRTSVDHGTALNLVGKEKANINSFITAINLAIKMINTT